MHWVLLEYEITKEELLIDLKYLFEDDFFYFLDEDKGGDIAIQFFSNKSYLKKHIQLFIHNEMEGFKYLDLLAEHLSKKYNCDAVRELSTQTAIKEFEDPFAIQTYSVLYRNGKNYIIPDDGIENTGFELKIIKELKN